MKDKRILVVYYSYTGSTELIASEIADALGADLLKLQLAKPMPQGGRAFAIGGLTAALGIKARLQAWDKDPSQYDAVIVGTPVWAWHTAPAFNRFWAEAKLQQPYALFSCSGDTPPAKLFDKAIQRVGTSPVCAPLGLVKVEGTRDKSIADARAWAASIVTALDKS